jgi:hypothetical protein
MLSAFLEMVKVGVLREDFQVEEDRPRQTLDEGKNESGKYMNSEE